MGVPLYNETQPRQLRRVIPDLIRARELLFDLVSKDLRVRYRYAAMGVLWAVVEPLLMTLILSFLAAVLNRGQGGANAVTPPLVLCGYVTWRFFSASVAGATRSLVDNRNLVKKVYFPREVVPLAAIGNALADYGIGLALALIAQALFGGGFSTSLLWFFPLFAVLLALIAGLGLLLSSYNVTFRDVGYMTDAALVIGFYTVPVFYTLPSVAEFGFMKAHPSLLFLYQLNPIAALIHCFQDAIVRGVAPDMRLLLWPTLLAVALLATGVTVFRRRAAALSDHL